MSETAVSTGLGRTRDWERYTPLAAPVIAVVLWVIGLILATDAGDHNKGSQILADYKAHDTEYLVAGLIWSIGVIVFIWFLGHLRTRLIATEGGDRLAATAFAGGVAAAIFGLLLPGPDMAGALNKDDIDASGAATLHHLSDAFFIGAEYVLPVLLFATGLIALRSLFLPKWFAWVTIVIGILLLIGPIGWAALIFAFPLWLIVTGVFLWRAATAAPRSAI